VPLLIGQIIGRLGNFTNQELFGYPTDLTWKIFIDPENRPGQFSQASYFHPVFAYEMIANAIGLLLLVWLKFKKPGQLTGAYLLVWATSRFMIEIWRISDRIVYDLSLAQLMSLLILPLAIYLLKYPRVEELRSKRQRPKPG
jgi:prolipoprotein diacylglyceryl transferase